MSFPPQNEEWLQRIVQRNCWVPIVFWCALQQVDLQVKRSNVDLWCSSRRVLSASSALVLDQCECWLPSKVGDEFSVPLLLLCYVFYHCFFQVGFSEFCLPLLIYHALKNEDVLKDVLSEVFHHWISTFLAYDSDVKKQSGRLFEQYVSIVVDISFDVNIVL